MRIASIFPVLLALPIIIVGLEIPASASVVSSGGGDYDIVPLYHSEVFGGISRAGDFSFGSEDVHINDYVSNIAPRTITFVDGTVIADGATFQGVGQAVWSGFFAGRNYAQATVTNARSTAAYYLVAGVGSATSVRFFDPSAAADHAVFTWHVSGTTVSSVGWADGRLDFGATTDTTVNWFNLFSDPDDKLDSITKYGPGTYSYVLPIVDLGTTINLFFWSSAFVQVKPGEVPEGSSYTQTANFSNTFYLANVGLYDAEGEAISSWTLTDLTRNEEVFNQTGRIAPIADAPALGAPEPGTWVLAFSGVSLLAWRRARGLIKHRTSDSRS